MLNPYPDDDMQLNRLLTTLASLTLVPALNAQTPALKAPLSLTKADSARYMSLGNSATRYLLGGRADSLAAMIDSTALERLGGVEGISKQQDNIAERAGVETRVVEEQLTRRNGMLQFWHAGEFSEVTGDQFVIRWLFDEHGKIVGAGLGPKSDTPAVDS